MANLKKHNSFNNSNKNVEDNEDDHDKPIELPILKRPPPTIANKSTTSSETQNDYKLRDPRFDPRVGGSNDVKHFVRNYSFIDDIRQDELKQLQQALRKEKNSEKKAKIKIAITRIRNKIVDGQNKVKKIELIDSMKKSLHNTSTTSNTSTNINKFEPNKSDSKEMPPIPRDSYKRPKNKFRNLKKSDIKKNLLVNKYKELKETGKLNKYLERKRKKLINRDGKVFS